MALGLAGVIGSRFLYNVKCKFWFELRNPIVAKRLRAILDRRDELEGLGRKPAIISSMIAVLPLPALLVGDDADLEVYVDERIRRSRVGALLTFAYAVIPVFIAVVTRDIDFMQGRTPRRDGT